MGYQELKEVLRTEFADIYVDDDRWPEAYCDSRNVKAIVLGADPSNPSGKRFQYAFGLEDQKSRYFSPIKSNLDVLGLKLDDLYFQDICRNYFTRVTYELPRRRWISAATKWPPYLKEELDSHRRISSDIPVLVTTEIILEALAPEVHSRSTPNKDYYRNCIFIEPKQNKLERTLIPFFRHHGYALASWGNYAKAVEEAVRRG